MAGGFQLGTLKFLFFAVTFITIFGVISLSIGGGYGQIENYNTGLVTDNTEATINIMTESYAGAHAIGNGIYDVKFTVQGYEFGLFGIHYSTQDDNEATYYCTYGPSNAVQSYWTDVAPEIWRSGLYPPLALPASLITVVNGYLDWEQAVGTRMAVVFDLGPFSSVPAGSSEIYAIQHVVLRLEQETTWTDRFTSAIGNIVLFVPRLFFGAIFGESGNNFVNTMGRVITCDFPGVPAALRLMVALPIAFMVVYCGLIIIRSFLPTVGGGSEG
jgi:hypothetical protein